jgi:hypothetical protein
MAKKEDKGEKWWVTIVVALVPSLIAGWFSLKAIDKANASSVTAEKTSGELTVAYDLMKQALEMVQHEADGNRDALMKTNELLIRLLRQKSKRNAAETEMLASAEAVNQKLLKPSPAPHHVFPPNLHDLLMEK